MKNLYLSFFILIIYPLVFSGSVSAKIPVWNDDTAFITPENQIRTGIFNPLKFRTIKRYEISLHPLLFFGYPYLRFKKRWYRNHIFNFAHSTSISYPTLLLKTFSREGSGGLLPANSKIPHIYQATHNLIFSFRFPHQLYLSFLMEISRSHSLDEKNFPQIELPLIYPRSWHYHEAFTIRNGIDFQGKLYKDFFFLLDFDIYYVPGNADKIHFEHKLAFSWTVNSKFNILAGYKLSVGSYPFGNRLYFFPLIDFQWIIDF